MPKHNFLDALRRHRKEQEWASTRVPELRDEDGKPWVVYAKPLTMRELEIVDRYGKRENTDIAKLTKTAQLALHDADGQPLFGQNDLKEVGALFESTLLQRIFKELGLLTAEEHEVLAYEEAEKNSATTNDDD